MLEVQFQQFLRTQLEMKDVPDARTLAKSPEMRKLARYIQERAITKKGAEMQRKRHELLQLQKVAQVIRSETGNQSTGEIVEEKNVLLGELTQSGAFPRRGAQQDTKLQYEPKNFPDIAQ